MYLFLFLLLIWHVFDHFHNPIVFVFFLSVIIVS